MAPYQTFPTDVGLRTNIFIIHCYQVKLLCLPPQLPLRRRDWPQWIKARTKYLQQTSGLRLSLSGSEHLACHKLRLCPNLFNRSRSPNNCLQLPLQLDGLLSTEARAFEPGAMTPPKPSEILTPGGPPTRSSEAFSIVIID